MDSDSDSDSDLPEKVTVTIVKDEKFRTTFKREGAAVPDTSKVNSKILNEGSKEFEVLPTNRLLDQLEDNDDVANELKDALRKISRRQGDPVLSSDFITLYWKVVFVSKTSAKFDLSVSGSFFENLFMEYKQPIKVKINFEFQAENESVTVESCEMSPTLSLDDQRICVFRNVFKEKIEEPIPVNKSTDTWITIDILAIRDVEIKDLPCKIHMGQSILESKIEFDFAIIADDDTRFECNKVFLASNSKAWAGMLQMHCRETREKAIYLKMSPRGVNALLKFIYYANLDDPMKTPSIALELLEIGHQYDILGLEKSMRSLFLGQKNEWFDIDTALLLYLRTLKVEGNDDLKWKALQAFKSKPDALEGSTAFENLLKEDSKTAKQLIAICFKI